MFDRIDAFVRDLAEVKTEAELADLLLDISREMGFSYFALTHHVDIRLAPRPAIRLANYPDDWIGYFDDNRLGLSDPVHRASQLTSAGFAWSQLSSLIKLTARDCEVLALAERRGIGDGFTIPAHVPGEANGSCSFATAAGDALSERHLPLAQLVGVFAFEAARRVWQMRYSGLAHRPTLTDRQRDCVVWAAQGKSDWEIARILGLSPETVTQYLKRARERYGVSKRTMLAVHALFDGTITFTDVLKR
ncbi:LuxR family transcriptional regulator [Altererythrobacter sp. Root672]|uniref:LuxR family transcriptional regulator n=1 Tax=Altererythrobacter sp. Root672 TaxID=1736584 RepID=UPI0006FBF6FF|nr:LuxR family transcriptional regulator [Altererythrobacter sp. Root672]KRA84100.1 LuxR family transcriptional regulator [Altererythrobacter sp. Root672]